MNLVWGILFFVLGIKFVNTQTSYDCPIFGWEPPPAGSVTGHVQNVIAGILMLIVGAMFLYSYFKKR